MRVRWLVVVLAALAAVAACNRLFGIAEIPYAGDAHAFEDAPPDATPMAILEIGDPALDFGQVTRGQKSFAAAVGITNVGDATTGVLALSATGSQTEYDVELGTCNTPLAPGAGCKLTITFTPTDVGTFNDTVVIGDGVAMTTIMLTGMGLAAGALTIASPIDFGSAAVGSNSDTQSITVANNSGGPVMIQTIALSGTGSGSYVATPTGLCAPTKTLNAGVMCTLPVNFEPTAGGTQLASLVVTTDSNPNPSTSSLGGTGTTTVMVATTGTGTVESSDLAIDCGSLCQATFDTSTVTLTGVVPAQTSIAWSPNCAMQSSTSCAITVNKPSYNVTATFTPFPVLTVALSGSPGKVTGGGIDCESGTGPTCSKAYQPGSSVMLTATPGTGDAFNDWTGACALNDSATCMLEMTGNLSTTADFEPTGSNVLNVTPEVDNGANAGDKISVGSQTCNVSLGCSFVYSDPPSSVTITATPGSCSTFEGFMGPCGSQDTFYQCTVDPAATQITTVLFAFQSTGGITDVCAQVGK